MATRHADEVGWRTRRAALGCFGIGALAAVGVIVCLIRLAILHRSPEFVEAALLTEIAGITAVYLTFAYHLVRRRFWAIVAATAVGAFVGLCFSAFAAYLAYFEVFENSVTAGYELLFLTIVGCYGVVGICQLWILYQLVRSLVEIRRDALDRHRGFDVLPAAVLPVQSGSEP